MESLYKKGSLVLLVGDFFFFSVSLWLALLLRNLEIPSRELLVIHLLPFSLLFVIWILVFYIAGLYEKHTVILRSKLPSVLANTQLVNSVLAVVFFYFVPYIVFFFENNHVSSRMPTRISFNGIAK